jgi:hypothetical protein
MVRVSLQDVAAGRNGGAEVVAVVLNLCPVRHEVKIPFEVVAARGSSDVRRAV